MNDLAERIARVRGLDAHARANVRGHLRNATERCNTAHVVSPP